MKEEYFNGEIMSAVTKKRAHRKIISTADGFTLPEVLAALVISAMVMTAVVLIYSRMQTAAAAINAKLEAQRLPAEIMQRITEDLDGILATGADTKITIDNKFDKGLSTGQLTILKTYQSNKNKSEVFEEIIWQTNYDFDTGSGRLILYRSHRGVAPEDKLLGKDKEQWERELFVPLCGGVSMFKVQALKGGELRDKWQDKSLPGAVMVTISFAEPVRSISGVLNIPDRQKITRTIAIDRTRNMKFEVAFNAPTESEGGNE